MKKIINNAADLEEEMIEGFIAANKQVQRLEKYNIILRRNLNPNKVSILGGGGSGHEPAHIGYVGFGMLDCAVAGPIFTSPTPVEILKGIEAVKTDKGVLCIVKNYTGDIMKR